MGKKSDSDTGADSAPVKARVLVQCALGAVNDVVEVDAETAEAGVAAGELDSSVEAVAYAESLK